MRKPSAYDLFYDPWNFSLLKIVEIKEEPLIIKNHTKQLKISEKEKNRTQIFLDWEETKQFRETYKIFFTAILRNIMNN